VQRGVAVIPKTSSEKRLVENKDVFGFELTDAEMGRIDGLDRNKRYNDPGDFCKGMGGDYPIFD
jgi:diketogulonate reductase-like aldo/keto reductase